MTVDSKRGAQQSANSGVADADKQAQMNAVWRRIARKADEKMEQERRSRSGREVMRMSDEIADKEAKEKAAAEAKREKVKSEKRRKRRIIAISAASAVVLAAVCVVVGLMLHNNSVSVAKSYKESLGVLNSDLPTVNNNINTAQLDFETYNSTVAGIPDYNTLIQNVELASQSIDNMLNDLSKNNNLSKGQVADVYAKFTDSYTGIKNILVDVDGLYQSMRGSIEGSTNLGQYEGNYLDLSNSDLTNCLNIINEMKRQVSGFDASNDDINNAVSAYIASYDALAQYVQSIIDGAPNSAMLDESITQYRDFLDRLSLLQTTISNTINDANESAEALKNYLQENK